MKTRETVRALFEKRPALSFEVFPPRTEMGMRRLTGKGGVLERLYELKPAYISCTYGAGGTNVGRNLDVLKTIKAAGCTIPVTHFTCIGGERESIRATLQHYLDCGIDHMLALRGDIPVGQDGTGGDFDYAYQLVTFVRETFGDRFTIAVGGMPEGHLDCRDMDLDIERLKQKQDVGADFIMTQLCWDMEQFRHWLHSIREAGITLPVDVGVMPVLDPAATVNMALSRNGCAIPRDLAEIISRHWIFPNVFAPNEPEDVLEVKKMAFREEGIAYTIKQIEEYKAMGVDGIHLYALNKYDAVAQIAEETGLI
ncbi:MAG: methylenetetrahydrofolate reductase [Firmicutes bacterium]|nr:methylenetetrahydrofolate reductase [Bacillota bacterium]